MVLLPVLKLLWSILDLRNRLYFSLLIVLLVITGVAEMGGMLVIFGFISGLRIEDNGKRSGAIARAVTYVLEAEPTQAQYVAVGGGGILAFMLIKNFLGMSAQFALTRFLMKRNQNICSQLFEGYLSAPYDLLLPGKIENVRNRINGTFEVLSRSFAATAQILADSITVFVVCLLLLAVHPVLTLIAAGAFAVVGTATYWTMQSNLRSIGAQARQAKKDANRALEHGLAGIVETRLGDLRGYFMRRYSRALHRASVMRRRRAALKRIPRSSNEILLTSMIVGSVFYLTSNNQSIEDALPTLALFGFAGLRLTGAMTRLNTGLQRLRVGAEKLDDIANTLRRVTPLLGPPDPNLAIGHYLADEQPLPDGVDGRLTESLRLENVTFRFPQSKRRAVSEVSVEIKRGSFVSFCGPSGSGKSTLLKLLMGLIAPTHGRVMCDGWEIQQHIRAWHENIGYVGQHLYLTEDSVRENIAFGVAPAKIDDQRVWKALELASAADFVRQLPAQLNTPLRSGDILSGGQTQRIVIARALYDDPTILVFDEATAALDNETEREITDAITRLSGTKTIICVAHRLSTIRKSDTIFVLRNGRIVGCGTYDELKAENPTFRRMARGRRKVQPAEA